MNKKVDSYKRLTLKDGKLTVVYDGEGKSVTVRKEAQSYSMYGSNSLYIGSTNLDNLINLLTELKKGIKEL